MQGRRVTQRVFCHNLRQGTALSLLSCQSSAFNACRSFSSSSKERRIALIPSDGVGKEVVPEAKRVLDKVASSLPFSLSYVTLEAGWETFTKTGNSLPKETIAALKTCDAALFGAVSSPSHKVEGYSSPIIGMRKALDLYANLRPIISSPVKGSRDNVDILIVRENTECLYVKQEKLEQTKEGKVAVANRVITEYASTRIAQMAFKQAVKRLQSRKATGKASRVTVVHKSNVLSVSDGLFRECCLKVAKEYPNIEVEEQLVDSMVYKLILDPQRYDVVVAPNLYGDILSDAAAALVGGLGIAPSANVGDAFLLAEPVHGSAPDIAGKGIVNPIATISAAAMLIRNLEEKAGSSSPVAAAIDAAVYKTLKEGPHTPDLGGSATTKQVTDKIIQSIQL